MVHKEEMSQELWIRIKGRARSGVAERKDESGMLDQKEMKRQKYWIRNSHEESCMLHFFFKKKDPGMVFQKVKKSQLVRKEKHEILDQKEINCVLKKKGRAKEWCTMVDHKERESQKLWVRRKGRARCSDSKRKEEPAMVNLKKWKSQKCWIRNSKSREHCI